MNGERDPRVPRAGGAGERFAQERLAVAHPSMLVLELGLERDAQLRRDRIDRRRFCQTDPRTSISAASPLAASASARCIAADAASPRLLAIVAPH
jgi:hypothetical protein